jgi:hypothetical protein
MGELLTDLLSSLQLQGVQRCSGVITAAAVRVDTAQLQQANLFTS